MNKEEILAKLKIQYYYFPYRNNEYDITLREAELSDIEFFLSTWHRIISNKLGREAYAKDYSDFFQNNSKPILHYISKANSILPNISYEKLDLIKKVASWTLNAYTESINLAMYNYLT